MNLTFLSIKSVAAMRLAFSTRYRILLLSCLFIFQSAWSQSKPWVVATYQYGDNNRIGNIKPLADHLGRLLNNPVEVRSYATVHLFLSALQSSEVDIALINTFGYLLLDASGRHHSMIPTVVLQPKAGTQDNYKTAIIASKNAGVQSIKALPQKAEKLRLALVSPGSTSGNLVPRLALSRLGLEHPEKQFQQLSYSGNHRLAIDSLLAGKADVCAVGSTEYFRLMEDSVRAAQCTLLWLSPEIPLGPVLLHKRLPDETRRKITTAFLDLHGQNSLALEAVKQGWSEAKEAEKYVPFSENYYTPFLNEIGSRESIKMIISQFAN
ncbi:phosphate/phosphite/phosphonate ABC transporter substrate-binding protein [Flavitalea antarctica]